MLSRAFALAAVLVSIPELTIAQPRLSTLSMSCHQARALVASRGAIVLSTGRFTYDRFVAHAGFCEIEQTTEPAFEPTTDDPQCPIGNRCRSRPPRDNFFRW
jgi:hypothetical protein